MIRSLFRATLVALLTIASLAVVHTATPASADTFEVTDPSDPAVITPNTLRWAIQEANNDTNPHTIDIEPGLDRCCSNDSKKFYPLMRCIITSEMIR
jgi:hypothetical protein